MTTRPLPAIDPASLKSRLDEPAELAFLDVREPGQYGAGHPFFAVNLPYSRLELDVGQLIPFKGTEIVLIDANDGVAQRAADRLREIGYSAVMMVQGGCPAWERAGFTLFDGVNLPSKTFGEVVEHTFHTPAIDAQTLQRMRESGEDFLLLDGRTAEEFCRMNIPGGRSCPNAELGHRLPALDSTGNKTVVVNCAGRTRSIIGAQSLINQGFNQRIVALENGTQGWQLAGYELARNSASIPLPELDSAAVATSRERARQTIERFSLPTVDTDRLRQWQEADQNVYLLDVRSAQEYAQGHLPGAWHAPGGQLTQATDAWVGVRGAKIVLCDDTGLRAANTAIWLRGMSHDAYVLDTDVCTQPKTTRDPPKQYRPAPLAQIEATAVAQALDAGALLLDMRASQSFREAHIEGALWTTRARVTAQIADTRSSTAIVAAENPGIAALAAKDLNAAGLNTILYLPGEPKLWRAAGLTLQNTPDNPPDTARIDFIFHTHDRHQGNLDAARAYLAWETELMARLDPQERAALRPLVPKS